MKLQLAIDRFTLEEAENILREVGDFVDIVEVGTPLLLREGVAAIKRFRAINPDIQILADMKIVDGAEYESTMAFNAGADIVTVLAAAEDTTISIARDTAQKYGKSVMVDLIGVMDPRSRAIYADRIGADYLCVHRSTDLVDMNPRNLDRLRTVKDVIRRAKIAVAGCVNNNTICDIVAEKPDVVIVGSYITSSSDRRRAAKFMKKSMDV